MELHRQLDPLYGQMLLFFLGRSELMRMVIG